MRAYAIYEHPQFTASPKDAQRSTVFAVLGSLTLVAAASTLAVYQLVNSGSVKLDWIPESFNGFRLH
ncbi:hypothetical protein PLICRDRAFT_170145 [Plicaturopsis crispa FD-325 SS-3]|nr:hypothetical protein PLICRDRAFT_170145 [Plicaturopsis crispa FD-325 SS-3]